MITMQMIYETIIDCCDFSVDIDINENTNLVNDLGYSSINYVQLIVALEEIMGTEFDYDDLLMDNIMTIKDLTEIIEKKAKIVMK